jgi:hypothetical protein
VAGESEISDFNNVVVSPLNLDGPIYGLIDDHNRKSPDNSHQNVLRLKVPVNNISVVYFIYALKYMPYDRVHNLFLSTELGIHGFKAAFGHEFKNEMNVSVTFEDLLQADDMCCSRECSQGHHFCPDLPDFLFVLLIGQLWKSDGLYCYLHTLIR